MITSVFNKSKPINSISVFLLLLFAFILMLFKYKFSAKAQVTLAWLGVNFVILFLSLFTLNFIVKKNSLSNNNSYVILCFGLFVATLPQVFMDHTILISNLLVLLSFRRLASLSSQRNTIKKLLDSGIYIAMATLFNAWSILFMILPFVALLYHSENIITYWLIPLMGFLSIVIITYTFGSCIPNWNPFNSNTFLYSLIFSAYKSPQLTLAIGFFVFLLLWSLLVYMPSISKKKRVLRPVYKLTLVYLGLSIVVVAIQPFKLGTEFLFLLAPFAVVSANYFQSSTYSWIKDSIFYLWILLVLFMAIKT